MKFEIFLDRSYYDMWAVRPEGDKNFNSPQLVHFETKELAEEFQKIAEKGLWAKCEYEE